MKRIIHTFVIAFQFIILSAVLTACKEDDGNISSPQEVTPSFFWEGSSFQLEADNGWGITRFANRVALSNFHQKCQYHLSWDGGSGAGEKTNGILKIAEAGKKLQTIRLDALLIEDINGMYYNIHFQKGEATGILLNNHARADGMSQNNHYQACDIPSLFF